MRKVKLGFTLVEVALFLVITAALFISIAVGTQNSIFQQRYNDTVQNYAEFLRQVYSQVNNVQSDGEGRSNKAIYGKLVTYGQTYDLAGEEIVDGAQHIFVYDVVGDVKGDCDVDEDCEVSGNILEQLNDLNANVVVPDGSGYKLAGYPTDYVPRWGAQIQTSAGWEDDSYDKFEGALLIVRHPDSGKVYTLAVTGEVIEVNKILRDFDLTEDTAMVDNLLKKYLVLQAEDERTLFSRMVVNFCVNPNGASKSNLRRDVKIVKGAKNSSGIEIVPDGGCDI